LDSIVCSIAPESDFPGIELRQAFSATAGDASAEAAAANREGVSNESFLFPGLAFRGRIWCFGPENGDSLQQILHSVEETRQTKRQGR